MVRTWRKVSAECADCMVTVGKIKLHEGTIRTEELNENWGTWQKVKGKAEMEVICKSCQKLRDKERNKQAQQ